MKKIMMILIALLLTVSVTVPAFATEVTENGDLEVGNSTNVVNPSDNLDNSQTGTDNGGKGSETPGSGDNGGSESDVTLFSEGDSEGSGNPVVDISDESIQAIADAIVNEDSISLTFSDGNVYLIKLRSNVTLYTWEDFVSDWDKYEYKVVCFSNFSCGLYLSNEELEMTTDGAPSGYYSLVTPDDGIAYSISKSSNTLFLNEKNPSSDFSDFYGTLAAFTDSWSNYNLIYNGELIHATDVARPYTISFVTGFDDLVIDSQIHTDFELPTPSYAGYTFAGWYLDSEFTTQYTGGEFTQDTTLYAKWIDEPDMAMFHSTIFDAFVQLFTYEPMIYIFSLMGLICIFAVGKRLIASRY